MLNEMVPRTYCIDAVKKETRDTFTLELKPQESGNGKFLPGQFNMLYVYGTGEVPISISGNPGRGESIVHTTRAVGTVTRVMWRMKPGDVLGVRGPYGNHWPVDEAIGSDVVIVAGGIGLAPLRPALYRILEQREKYGKVVLLYGTRTPQDMLFRRELETWRSRFDLDVHVTVDNAAGAWRGNVGFVTTLIRRAPLDPLQTVAMVCGPELMMRYAAMELLRRGVDADQIYVSMERNMKCGCGLCGHCQLGPEFICKDGPIFTYKRIATLIARGEI